MRAIDWILMRLCQLVSSYHQSDSLFRALDPYYDAARWLPEHEWTCQLLDKASAAATLDALSARGFDAFVNLCDGEPGEDIAGIEVVEQLERLGVPFTGADSRWYAIGSSRRAFKQGCAAAAVDTPAHAFVEGDPACAEALAGHLRYPILVKPPNGYASIGIHKTSRVTTPEALRTECTRTVAAFGGALLEEFIDGREFTVLIAEPPPGSDIPIAFRPVEIVFAPGETFKHFALKWQSYDTMGVRPVDDPGLAEELQRTVQRLFVTLGGVGYCRCDIRMDGAGRIHVVDCNTMPGLFYPPGLFGAADLILAQEEAGHRRFLQHLIDSALARAARRQAGPRSASTTTS